MQEKKQFDTPILFLVFNRPETTQKVFERIRTLQPKYLYVAADGPRKGNTKDEHSCQAVRAIFDKIDWNCELITLFRKENLGCGRGVSGAIDWFFNQVEAGIIIEDDILGDLSFFSYCEFMLKKYKHDKRIWHINGFVPVELNQESPSQNYFFTKYPMIWGWATWKDRWESYNFKLAKLQAPFLKKLKEKFPSRRERIVHINSINNSQKIDTWDAQWKYTIFSHNGLCISPYKNLIENIGFGNDATHTTDPNHRYAQLKTETINTNFESDNKKIGTSKINEKLMGQHLYQRRYNWKEELAFIKNFIHLD